MRKAKKLSVFIFSLIMLFGLAGCNPSSNSNPTSNETSINEEDNYIREIYNLYLENGGNLTYEEWLASIKGEKGDPGKDGLTPYIGENGNWWIGDEDTGIPATGPQGPTGDSGPKGDPGKDGVSIVSSYINEEGYLIVELSDGSTINAGKVIGDDENINYTVTYYVNDEVWGSETVKKGSLLTKPESPVEECKYFMGWYDENDDKWIFNAFCLNKNLSLYGKFEDSHSFNQKNMSPDYCIKKETCELAGEYYYSCECGKKSTETFVVEPSGHNFFTGWCLNCSTVIFDVIDYHLGENYFKTYAPSYYEFYLEVYWRMWDVYMNVPTTLEDLTFDQPAGLSFYEAAAVACKVIMDYPLFYFVNQTFTLDSVTNTFIIDVPDKYYLHESRVEAQNQIETFLNDFNASYAESDANILTKAHDYIINRVDYEYNSEGNPSEEVHAHNIMGVINSVGAVCEGYAKSFHLLSTLYNIPSYVVTGEVPSGENHAWNLVQVDGEWYWCDLTWDDLENWDVLPWSSIQGEEYFSLRYTYFLVADNPFIYTHVVSNEFKEDLLPFIYELPERAKEDYFVNHSREQYDYFEVDNIYYQTVDNYSVTVAYIDKEGDVEIPSTVNNNNNTYNVVSIGTYYTGELLTPSTLYSFNNESIVVTSEKVRTVTIPESVKTIYEGALSSRNGLDTEKTVKSYFQNHLENIFVDENNKYFCSVDGVLYTKDKKYLIAYPFEKKETEYVMEDETISMDPFAFAGFSGLKHLVLGKSFENYEIFGFISRYFNINEGTISVDEENKLFYIHDGIIYITVNIMKQFCDFGSLPVASMIGFSNFNQESYTLIDSFTKDGIDYDVKAFDLYGFQDYSILDNNFIPFGILDSMFDLITCDTEFIVQNDMFEFIDGCLYYNESLLYLSPSIEEFTITTERFIEIPSRYLQEEDGLKKVIIEEGITKIGNGLFCDCDGLTTVVIPSTVVEIEDYPFALCDNMKEIYYNGTKDQWESIIKKDNWKDWLFNVILHCNDGDFIINE